MIDPTAIEKTLLDLVGALEPGSTIGPSEAAQRLGGKSGDAWGPLMQPVRRVAVRLAKEGRLVIYRKGAPVDPDDFKGVYRIGPVRLD